MIKNMLKECKITTIAGYIAAGSTAISPDEVIDMQGYEGVCFIASMGTVTAAGVINLRPQHSTSTSTTDMVDCAAAYRAGTTSSTTAMTDLCVVVDVYKPTKRYMSAKLHRATQNSVLNSLIAIQYGARDMPTAQTTGVGTGGVFASAQVTAPTS